MDRFRFSWFVGDRLAGHRQIAPCNMKTWCHHRVHIRCASTYIATKVNPAGNPNELSPRSARDSKRHSTEPLSHFENQVETLTVPHCWLEIQRETLSERYGRFETKKGDWTIPYGHLETQRDKRTEPHVTWWPKGTLELNTTISWRPKGHPIWACYNCKVYKLYITVYILVFC